MAVKAHKTQWTLDQTQRKYKKKKKQCCKSLKKTLTKHKKVVCECFRCSITKHTKTAVFYVLLFQFLFAGVFLSWCI